MNKDFLLSYLCKYEQIIVLANSSSLRIFFLLNNINAKKLLVIIFNRAEFESLPKNIDILWIHRLDEGMGRFFGSGNSDVAPQKDLRSVFHLCIQNDRTYLQVPSWSIGILSALEDTPDISSYPVGNRLFCIKKKHIISPSTGFIILSLINRYKSNSKLTANVKAIGFGKIANGYHGHDWRFERKMFLRFKEINFVNFSLKEEPLRMLARALIPNFVIAIYFDIKLKF